MDMMLGNLVHPYIQSATILCDRVSTNALIIYGGSSVVWSVHALSHCIHILKEGPITW